MRKLIKWILGILLAALLIVELVQFGYLGFWLPHNDAENTMPDSGCMTLTWKEDGKLILSWPKGKNQDRYLVQVLRGQEVLYEGYAEQESCSLPELPTDEKLSICVKTARGYRYPFDTEDRIRMGERDMTVTTVLDMPAVSDFSWTVDSDAMQVKIQFALEEDTLCRMYHVDSEGKQTALDTLTQGDVTVALGEDGDFPVPAPGEKLTFAFDAYRETPNINYYGAVTQLATVTREDLLERELAPEYTDEGNNVFTFTWAETKGEYYEVQQLDPGTQIWKTLSRIEQGEERSCTTGHLSRYSELQFRVVAVGGQTLPNSRFAAVSEVITVSTGASAVYSTVWPIQELEVYGDPEKSQVIGTAPAAEAYCVTDVREGMFRIRYGNGDGYIDSNYCMINLPEFLGDICLYDITNSSNSLYTAHEYELPGVTGQVITGYEKVAMASGEQLVPLLYPAALKLEKAAFAAMEQGYKLKLYDAYCPREATQALCDHAIGLADQPIPEMTYTGKVLQDLPRLEEDQVLTYRILMTDSGRYDMNSILTESHSRHDLGVAMDLTLVDMETGEELRMQTSIHDLSHYSERGENNDSAKTLAAIMEGAGFAGTDTEWWHFQDTEAQSILAQEYQWEGVTPECWVADDTGWRYRKDDGEYYVNCSATIEGVQYAFDGDGYLVEE